MGVAFGRLVVDGVELDDPYLPKLDDLRCFEVISDSGPRYRIERLNSRRHFGWQVSRVEPPPATLIGQVRRGGNVLDRWYSYKRHGRVLSSGTQNILMNAVFALIGEQDGTAAEFRFNN